MGLGSGAAAFLVLVVHEEAYHGLRKSICPGICLGICRNICLGMPTKVPRHAELEGTMVQKIRGNGANQFRTSWLDGFSWNPIRFFLFINIAFALT